MPPNAIGHVNEYLQKRGMTLDDRFDLQEVGPDDEKMFKCHITYVRTHRCLKVPATECVFTPPPLLAWQRVNGDVFESAGATSKKAAKQDAYERVWQQWSTTDNVPPPAARAPAADRAPAAAAPVEHTLTERSIAIVVGTPLLSAGRLVHLRSRNERTGEWWTRDNMSGAEIGYTDNQLAPFSFHSKVADSLYALLTYLLYEDGHSVRQHLIAHHFELPLLYLANCLPLRKLLAHVASPSERLALLQQAVDYTPGLELRHGGTHVRREPLRQAGSAVAAGGQLPPSLEAGIEAGIPTLRLPCAASSLPVPLLLPAQAGYLDSIGKALGTDGPVMILPTNTPRPSERRPVQPLVYAAISSTAAPNALASLLCGVEVRGDALLAHADFMEEAEAEADGVAEAAAAAPPTLTLRLGPPQSSGPQRAVSSDRAAVSLMAELGRQLARREGVAGFIAARQQRPCLS